jgi:WD40 repeat protein
MPKQWLITASMILLLSGTTARAQGKAVPIPAGAAGDTEPLLRLEAGGPASSVNALAFSPDGQTLYAAGFDKVVRGWRLEAPGKQFALDPVAFRVPVGPGRTGVLNVLAISPDGAWVAASGRGVFRIASRSREPGRIYPYLPPHDSEMLREQATIYLFDTKTQEVRLLHGSRA